MNEYRRIYRLTTYTDQDTYKAFKIYAIQTGEGVSSCLERLIRQELESVVREGGTGDKKV